MPRRKTILIVSLIVIALMLCGCSSGTGTQDTDWSQRVAATIDGHDIMESDVNDFISRFRKMSNLKTDAEWATYLDKQGVTTSQFRDGAIEQLEADYAVRKVAGDNGITVSNDEVNERIRQARQSAGYADDDDGWKSFLSDAGYTEDAYRDDVETSLMRQKYAEANAIVTTPSPSQLLGYAMSTGRYSGKKVYAGKFARRKDALIAKDALTDGMSATDFSDAIANAGGTATEVGWSGLASMSQWAKQAIADIGPGQASDVVPESNGYAIYYVEQQVTADDDGRIDVSSLPRDLYDRLVADASSYYGADAEQKALESLVQSYSPTKSDMPDGLPYDIDVKANSTYSPSGEAGDDANANENEVE